MQALLFIQIRPTWVVGHDGDFFFQYTGDLLFKRYHNFFLQLTIYWEMVGIHASSKHGTMR
jgi:hypothetical protein